MAQNKIREAFDRIEQGRANIETDGDWLKYLRFQTRFYHYSFGNTMLIYLQNPEASYVMGYKAWNKIGRYVKRGSKGLAILAPCFRKEETFKEPANKAEYNDSEAEKEIRRVLSGFRITYVYDIADTDGSDEMLSVLVKGLSGNSPNECELYESLYNIISKEFTVDEITGTASKGSYNLETGRIAIRTDLEYLQRIKTLLHEAAHAYDFAMNPDKKIPRNHRELIAESVAFVVSLHLGLDTSSYSMGYIKSWLKDTDELKTIADTVQKISEKIITLLAESDDSAFSLEESEE